MSTPEMVVAIIVAFVSGGIVPQIGKGVVWLVTGRQERERSALQKAYADLDLERSKRDAEASYARRVAEHAHHVRALAIKHGIESLPEFPSRSDRTTG